MTAPFRCGRLIFPGLVPHKRSGRRRLTLFLPWQELQNDAGDCANVLNLAGARWTSLKIVWAYHHRLRWSHQSPTYGFRSIHLERWKANSSIGMGHRFPEPTLPASSIESAKAVGSLLRNRASLRMRGNNLVNIWLTRFPPPELFTSGPRLRPILYAISGRSNTWARTVTAISSILVPPISVKPGEKPASLLRSATVVFPCFLEIVINSSLRTILGQSDSGAHQTFLCRRGPERTIVWVSIFAPQY